MKINRIVRLTLGFVVLISTISLGETKYYRQYEEVDLPYYRLSYPISYSLAKIVNCFKAEYDSLGRLESATFLRNGKPAIHPQKGFSQFRIFHKPGYDLLQYLNLEGKPSFPDTALSAMIVRLDSLGLPMVISYLGKGNTAIPDSSGVYFYLLKTDPQGRPLSYYRLNASGDTISNKMGDYFTRNTYDSNGFLIETANLDENGSPLNNYSGYAIARIRHDSIGNQIEDSFFDQDDRRVLVNDFNAATFKFDYDANGYIECLTQYDADGNISGIDDLSNPILRSKHDEKGNLCEYTYCARDNTIREKIALNEWGAQTEHCFYNSDGTLRLDRVYGYARFIRPCNNNGDMLEMSFQGPDSQLIEPPDIGYAHIEVDYNSDSQPIEQRYYNKFHQLTELPDSKTAITRWKHDKNGNITEVSSYGADGKLKEDATVGIAIGRMKYDKNGNEIEMAGYGIDNKLKNADGSFYCIIRRKYDSNSNMTELSQYDTDNKLVESPESGIAMIKVTYDDRGNLLSSSYYDKSGQLYLPPGSNFASLVLKYDEKNRIVEESYFSADNKPFIASFGFARMQTDFNEYGQATEYRYYGTDGNLINAPDYGAAVVRYKYNSLGILMERTTFDSNMKIINHETRE